MLNPLSAFLEMKWVRLVICVVLVGLWGSACVPKPCLTWGKKSKTITYMQPIERPMYVEKMKCLERGKAGDRGVQHPDWQPKSTEQCQTTYLRTTLLDEGVYGTSERNECGDYGLGT